MEAEPALSLRAILPHMNAPRGFACLLKIFEGPGYRANASIAVTFDTQSSIYL